MWSSSNPGHGAGAVRYDVGSSGQYRGGGIGRSEEQKADTDPNKEVIAKLLKDLDVAEKTSKNQTVQDLRDKLNEKRAELGDDKFKAILEQLKKEMYGDLLALLKRLFPELFPEDQDTPTSSPPPSSARSAGGDGGGRVRADPANYGAAQSMSDKPFTEGAGYTNYKVDKSNPGKKPGMNREAGNIWSGFSQGPDGNCVTVSAIKAAMMRFGQKATDIFKDVRESGNGWDVQMRDGDKIYHLSKDELKVAAQQARFKGDDPAMITEANFLYAVSAKRAQMDGNDGKTGLTFLEATQTLNDREKSLEGLHRLGLKAYVRPTSSSALSNSMGLGIVDDGEHSMAVLGGRLEIYGQRGGSPAQPNAFALV